MGTRFLLTWFWTVNFGVCCNVCRQCGCIKEGAVYLYCSEMPLKYRITAISVIFADTVLCFTDILEMAVLQGSQSKVEPTDRVYINSPYCIGHFLLWNCLPENRQHCCVVIDITTCSSPLGCAQCCAAYVVWICLAQKSSLIVHLYCASSGLYLIIAAMCQIYCGYTFWSVCTSRKLFFYFLVILKSLNDKQQIWVFGEMMYKGRVGILLSYHALSKNNWYITFNPNSQQHQN